MENQKNENNSFNIAKELYEWASALVGAIVGIILMFAFAASIYFVQGTSMQDTLQPDEMMLISRLFYTPERGDIALFTKHGLDDAIDPETGRYSPFVKRIIALGGDTVDYDPETERFIVNGVPLEENYTKGSTAARGDTEFPLYVEPGYVFVLGDHRDVSLDGRYSRVGLVDERFILGKVLLRIMPFSKFGTV